MLKKLKSKILIPLLGIPLVIVPGLPQARTVSPSRLVTQVIDERQTVELPGNIRQEATAGNDRGRVDDNLVLEHMQLLLNRPAETEAALDRFIDQLYDPNSPNSHRWLTPEQFGAEFGPAREDVSAVTDWLGRHGFTVNNVQKSAMVIDFSGTAEQVRRTFQTEIHKLDINGVAHIANMSNPRVPQALAGIVRGVVSLHDFRPHASFKPRRAYTIPSLFATYNAVVPADLATIYNLQPLFAAGITGKGQTIGVIENTNMYDVADWSAFRSTFGLSGYATGSLSQIHPGNCADPGVVAGNEMEAELDAEWASAAAPGAAIVVASCKDTSTTFGGLIALQNLLNSGNAPAIVSISYSECEAENGVAANAAYNAAYQQAASQGVSVFVAAGDEGAAGCDPNVTSATHGIGVNGLASTPYNVAVGGTDFGDTYAGTNSTYWSSTNSSTYGSALSYVNEIPWNDSCASTLLAAANGYSTTYGRGGFCNSLYGLLFYQTTASGSGGPSGCATGVPRQQGIVGGTCKGYAKPSWQMSLVGNPSDLVRDLPDVSLFAADGAWGHFYVFCDSDAADGGVACTGEPSGWAGAGGTSFASPIWAGFQALVNEKKNASQGNPNPVLYRLAKTEYGAGGSSICNSSNGRNVGGSCIFYNVTQGDMDVNCTGSINCYRAGGVSGVLSTTSNSYRKAFGAGVGWNFATGIGTVNVTNLVNSW
ncbi:protease pro-enzyme activation domain-containing protein [Burkholderia ubonensis]|uniref:S53 family peptidase n=1 Tax=Burkholderia ubonensis TaxID=101571 RepID=UPI000B1CEFD0|nr:S53 family peptidase [Burkholderia ubonensis]